MGGIVGTPLDVVNIRCQNDGKLSRYDRRNYKNVFDGIYQIAKHEPRSLWSGVLPNSLRAIVLTISQNSVYDLMKSELLLNREGFKDDIYTHFTASLVSGLIATTLANPFDLLKTRMMADRKSGVSSFVVCKDIMRFEGFRALYKGWTASYIRMGPQTTLIFVFYEQIKIMFGYSWFGGQY